MSPEGVNRITPSVDEMVGLREDAACSQWPEGRVGELLLEQAVSSFSEKKKRKKERYHW